MGPCQGMTLKKKLKLPSNPSPKENFQVPIPYTVLKQFFSKLRSMSRNHIKEEAEIACKP
jgi:hypothetical protein